MEVRNRQLTDKYVDNYHQALFSNSAVLASARNIDYEIGEIIFKKSMPIASLTYIESGLVMVMDGGGYTKNISVLYTKGDFICASEVLENKYYSSTAVAADYTRTYVINLGRLKQNLVINDNELLQVLNPLKWKDILKYNQRANELKQDIDDRVYNYLRFLSDKVYNSPRFSLGMSRSEISNYLGINQKSFIQSLNDLQARKKIYFDGKTIIVF